MATVIPLLTGNFLSDEDPVAIAAGTAVVDLTAAEQNSKYRKWALTAAASPANLPRNYYRMYFYVDNTTSTQAAVISQGGVTVMTVPAGARYEGWRPMIHVGSEACTVTMAGTTVNPCIVIERSSI